MGTPPETLNLTSLLSAIEEAESALYSAQERLDELTTEASRMHEKICTLMPDEPEMPDDTDNAEDDAKATEAYDAEMETYEKWEEVINLLDQLSYNCSVDDLAVDEWEINDAIESIDWDSAKQPTITIITP